MLEFSIGWKKLLPELTVEDLDLDCLGLLSFGLEIAIPESSAISGITKNARKNTILTGK